MNLCSHWHEEICFDGHRCPMCELKSELEDAQKSIDALKEKIEQLEKGR
jgi:transcription initiation factor IIE alpha subunit